MAIVKIGGNGKHAASAARRLREVEHLEHNLGIDPGVESKHGATPARRSRGRPKSLEAGNRLHISIPESLTQRLLEIQRDTHASSITEVVKNALMLYAAAIEEHKSGGHLYFKRSDGDKERQLALFI
jgi:hypothetical protein